MPEGVTYRIGTLSRRLLGRQTHRSAQHALSFTTHTEMVCAWQNLENALALYSLVGNPDE